VEDRFVQPEGQWGDGSGPESWTNLFSIPVHVRFLFLPLPSKMYLLWWKNVIMTGKRCNVLTMF